MALLTLLTLPVITANNLLCSNNSWHVIKGSWTFDPINCHLENTDSGNGNNIWFGSPDGLIPDQRFDFNSFTLKTTFKINSGTGNAGIMFRTQNASNVNNEGPNYYAGISTTGNYTLFGIHDNGWNNMEQKGSNYAVDTVYELSISASESWYTMYINGSLIFDNIYASQLKTGSIGLRTYQSPTTFYSLSYEAKIKIESCNKNGYYLNYNNSDILRIDSADLSNEFNRDSTFMLIRPAMIGNIDYITLSAINTSTPYVGYSSSSSVTMSAYNETSFKMVSALNGDPNCISFQSYKNHTIYLRHYQQQNICK